MFSYSCVVIKQLLHKTFSITMTLLVLFSTVSFTIEKHFCCNVLVDISYFVEGDNWPAKSLKDLQEKRCCRDEIHIVEGQDELQLESFDDFDIQPEFLTAFVYTYINLFEDLPKQVIPHKDYSPPNLVADIQVLDQVFII